MAANSRKPSQIYPNSPTSSPSFMPQQIQDPSIKGLSFDQLANNRGIRFIHKRAAPCPNMTSIADNNHDPQCPVCDGSGIMYYCEKEIYGLWTSNSLEKNFEQQGLWEIGTSVITFPALYDDGEVAEFNTFDQLEIPDFPVRMWELKEWDNRANKSVRLRYPVDTIDIVFSVRSQVRNDFVEGVDYNIVNNQIIWVTGLEPNYDNTNERGEVYTVVYHANPRYNVLQQLRELRVTQELVNGQKIATRLPQQILVKRDFLLNLPETEA